MPKAVLNYTTTVETGRTVAEITEILARAGASRISVDYSDRRPVAVSFAIGLPGGTGDYRLPARPARALELLRRQKVAPRHATPEHSERVAWRIVKDWLEAQLAMIESGQVELGEVLFPFLFDGERTAFEAFMDSRKQIGSE